MFCWWPLPGCVEHSQHAHPVANQVVNQNVVGVNYQLTGAFHPADTTQAGMLKQMPCIF